MNKKGFATIWIVLIILGLIGTSLLFKFWLGPKIFFKQVDTAHQIIDKTYDADNAINNYEWFKLQYENIQATEKQIDNSVTELDNFKEMFGEPKEWDYTTKQEYSRLSSISLGQKNHYESQVAEYNAKSKMANRNIFMNKLPFNVDKKIW